MTRLHAAIEIAPQLVRLQKLAGAFEHDVATEIAPEGHRREAAALEADAVAADRDGVIAIPARKSCRQRP